MSLRRVLGSTSYHLQTLQHRQEDGVTAATCELSKGTARLCRGSSPCILASCFSVYFCLASVPSGVGLSQLPDPQKGAALFFGESCYLWNSWLGARWWDRRASDCLS